MTQFSNNKKEAKEKIGKLRNLIDRHRYLYHVLDKQEISDSALDSLKKELFDLEQKFPDLVSSDSPTQRVAGKPLDKFEKVSHKTPMISLNDAFSKEDMRDWLERISKLLTEEERQKIDFFCELKIDGLAIELIYEKGIFKIGSTRGDGHIGENVTQNLKTIDAIPLKLEKSADITVRGEVFLSKKEFEKNNKAQKKIGLPAYANPRNLAAGSIRQLDPKITAARHLDSFAYELITDYNAKTHEDKHKIIKDFGFKINPYNKYCKNLEEVFSFHSYCQKIREKIPYEIDGIVVIINSNEIFEKLGVVGKAPRGAIAFKFPGKEAVTIVKDIKIQVGRTGALTPVAYLEPVEVGGTTVSRATLHNEDEIKKLGLKIGDNVVVGRAGDVIPDIIRVLPELRNGREIDFKMPSRCPACGSSILKPKGEVIARCSNSECFAQKRENFYHFVSKGAFNIVGLGPKIVDRLIDEGLVLDPSDLFDLKEGDILPIERFAEKSAGNLINSIQLHKEIIFSRFIYSLGIRNVGEETAYDLAEKFGNLENLKKAAQQELEEIKDIGPIISQSIFKWFSSEKNINFLNKLEKSGVVVKREEKVAGNQKLKDKIFVLTGTMEKITRDEAKKKIKFLGGKTSESVSNNTNFVVVGKNPGSKFIDAKVKGTRMISEEEFLELIK